MARYFISLGVLFAGADSAVFGQTLPPIQLDRPDQTECPFIVPKGYFQMENGFTIEDDGMGQNQYSHPSSLWKYGVNDRFELRMITEWITDAAGDSTQSGLLPVTLGFKTSLCEEHGVVPETSFIGHLTTACGGSEQYHTSHTAPAFRFTMQHTLSESISLGYNVGAEWDGETAIPLYVYTLTSGFSLTDAIGCYLEVYGYAAREQRTDHRFDCGATWLIHPDVMADLSGGFGMSSEAPDYYISMGISYRLKLRQN